MVWGIVALLFIFELIATTRASNSILVDLLLSVKLDCSTEVSPCRLPTVISYRAWCSPLFALVVIIVFVSSALIDRHLVLT